MKTLLLAVILSVQLAATVADKCSDCFATYETDTAGGADDTAKCNALKTMLTCLVDGPSSTCTLQASQAASIGTDLDSLTGCTLSETCKCQKVFWETDQTDGDGAVCTAAYLYHDCLGDNPGTGCDGTSTQADLLPFAQGTIDGITSCSLNTKTCGVCTEEYGKEAADTNEMKCGSLTNYIDCMEEAVLCPLTATAAAVLGTDYEAIKDDCPLSDVCTCQKNYWMTDLTNDDNASCVAVATLKTCLESVTSATETGCDDETVGASIKTYEKTNVRDIECPGSGTGKNCSDTHALFLSLLMMVASTLIISP